MIMIIDPPTDSNRVPATFVPSDRAFSIAGQVVNAKRACLLPDNVNMLVFLAENVDK